MEELHTEEELNEIWRGYLERPTHRHEIIFNTDTVQKMSVHTPQGVATYGDDFVNSTISAMYTRLRSDNEEKWGLWVRVNN